MRRATAASRPGLRSTSAEMTAIAPYRFAPPAPEWEALIALGSALLIVRLAPGGEAPPRPGASGVHDREGTTRADSALGAAASASTRLMTTRTVRFHILNVRVPTRRRGGLCSPRPLRPGSKGVKVESRHGRRSRPDFQRLASCQSSPAPTSTSSGGSSGNAPHISSRRSSFTAETSASGASTSSSSCT
jgi:hypothetical protein